MVATSNCCLASSNWILNGPTYWITSENLTMFNTHEQSPAAAFDLD